jgi:hypothetical protein
VLPKAAAHRGLLTDHHDPNDAGRWLRCEHAVMITLRRKLCRHRCDGQPSQALIAQTAARAAAWRWVWFRSRIEIRQRECLACDRRVGAVWGALC